MANRLSENLNTEVHSRIHAAMWINMISSVSIYAVGIYLSASELKISWILPVCSALAIATGISALNLRKLIRVYENLQQMERNILLQGRQEVLYEAEPSNQVLDFLQDSNHLDRY